MAPRPTYEALSVRVAELETQNLILQRIIDNSPDIVVYLDAEGIVQRISRVAPGYRVADVLGAQFVSFLGDTQRERFEQAIEEAQRSGQPAEYEVRLVSPSGVSIDWFNRVSAIKSEGTLTGFVINCTDVTERKRADAALRLKDLVFDTSIAAVSAADAQGRLTEVNAAFLKQWGYERKEEVIGRSVVTFLTEESAARAILATLNETGVWQGDYIGKRKDGSTFIAFGLATTLQDAEGAIIGYQSSVIDITERTRAEEALAASEEQYRALFNAMLDGVALHDIICDDQGVPCDYRFLQVNPAFEELTGLRAEDVVGRTVLEALPQTEPYWIETYGKVALTGESVRFQNYSAQLKKHFEVVAFCPCKGQFAAVFSDITARKEAEGERARLEQQLRQAYKMEALGTLAGGIAHDFNNVLGIIVGNVELAADDISAANPAHLSLREARQGCVRAREMVRQILNFSRRKDRELRPFDTKRVVREALKMIRSSIPSTIAIQHEVAGDNAVICGDPTELYQIVMNLCTNASQAMEESGGILRVKLATVTMDAEAVRGLSPLAAGQYVRLTVSDTGCGIAADAMSRIFDPYFTTKGVGQGTGMGLAVVYGIVQEYGGAVHVYSEKGRGTTFHVFLPEVPLEDEEPSDVPSTLPGGVERILLVDDDVALVNTGQRMLESLGYTVDAVTSSDHALEVFKANPGEFDLVVSDMTMPQMTGEALAQELMRVRPDIPCILCTGFSHRIDEKKAMARGIRGFVMKPLVRSEFAKVVRQVLDATR